MRTLMTLLLAATLLTLGGCKPGKIVKPVAAYNFEVRGEGAQTKGQGSTFTVQAGANSAALKDGRLTVNGKSYGVIAEGATILVEESGKVLINGAERQPE